MASTDTSLQEAGVEGGTGREEQTGGLEDWRTGGLEDWKTEGMEEWRNRRMEEWRNGGPVLRGSDGLVVRLHPEEVSGGVDQPGEVEDGNIPGEGRGRPGHVGQGH